MEVTSRRRVGEEEHREHVLTPSAGRGECPCSPFAERHADHDGAG